MTLINGRTPEHHARWSRAHAMVAAMLALLLLLLWLMGKGPGSAAAGGSCCMRAAPAVATTAASAVVESATATPEVSVPAAVESAPAVAAEPAPAAPVATPPAANVYFAVDKFDVPEDTTAKLADIVTWLKDHPSAMAVVSGYHDPTGNRDHNIELAKKRAFAVRDNLMANGIEEARIDMAKPIETTGSGDLQEARRVEISVRN